MSIETMDAAIDEIQELRAKLQDAESKLKIAEEVIQYFAGFDVPNNAHPADFQTADLNFPVYLKKSREALKQIRGE